MTIPPARHLYTLFGMRISSEFALPGLPCCDGPPEVMIETGPVPRHLPGATKTTISQETTPEEGLIHAGSWARFLVRSGTRVCVHRRRGVPDAQLRPFLLGSVAGLLLHQRGALPLHGSAVAVAGGAVALVGLRGAGKSTLAALLHRRGYTVLTDDICAVTESQGRFLVQPGTRAMKLNKDVLKALGEDPATHPLLASNPRKHRYSVDVSHDSRELPLRAVYVLGRRAHVGIAALAPADALPFLRRFTYRRRLLPGMGRVRAHFHLCAGLARHVPVQRLWRTECWSDTDDLLDLLDSDFAAETGSDG